MFFQNNRNTMSLSRKKEPRKEAIALLNRMKFMALVMLLLGLMPMQLQAVPLFFGEQFSAGTTPRSVTSADFNGDGIADMAVANFTSNNVSILLAVGDGTFNAAVNYATGSAPRSVTTADFNGDGFADMAVANSSPSSVSILLGVGDGTFNAAVNYIAGTAPYSVTSADFNGDGFMDMAVANRTSNNVSVLLGVGNGTFNAAVNYTAGTAPVSVSSGDFNGDGFADMAVANLNSSNVSVLLGVGNGTFNAAVSYAVGTSPFSVTTVDFNGDGFADMAVANLNSSNISVLLGVGNGTFNPAVNYAVGISPTSVTSADFNGDGFADMAVVNSNSNNASVLLGVGDGTFHVAVNYAAGTTPESVTTGDFNGDGFADMALANINSHDITVLLGMGDGTFNVSVNYAAGTAPYSVSSGDFNGDGFADMAVANKTSNNISVFLGIGDGTFNGAVNYTAGTGPESVSSGDFNGDGFADMAVANFTSGGVSVFLAVGDGTFNPPVTYTAGTNPTSVTNTDFNGDGFADIAVANLNSGNVSVLLGVGNGTFSAAVNYTVGAAIGTAPQSVTSGDFNGDGFADMAVANRNANNVSVLLGIGDGTFNATVNYTTGTTPYEVASADFNGDGFSDMVVANFTSNDVSILLAVGNGTFNAAVNYATGANSNPRSVTTGDFNGDGFADMVIAKSSSNNVSVLLGVGDGTFNAAVNYALDTNANPRSITTGDFNGDGSLDMAVANFISYNVTVLLNQLDLAAPTGTISIDAGVSATNSIAVTLTLTCSDNVACTQMQFSNNNTTWKALVANAASAAHTLVNGADGIRTVYARFTDATGNVSTAVSDTITLDTVAPAVPVITTPISNALNNSAARPTISGTAEANASVTVLDGATSLGLVTVTGGNWSLASGAATLTEATHSFTAIATDAASNASAASTAITYTVDLTAPVITTPANITVEATAASGTAKTLAAIAAFLNAASTADTVDGVGLASNNAPAIFPIGVTTVSFSATDAAGNAAVSAAATVRVSDTVAPVITATPLANVTAEATGVHTAVTLVVPLATDAVGAIVTNNAPVAGFPVGTTVVIWTATDAAGNTSTVNQNVIVSDTIAPVITGTPLADVTAEATAANTAITLTPPTATDAVGATVSNNAPVAGFPVGTTVVIWTAIDVAGNASTANQNVIVSDTTAPSITLLGADPYTLLAGQSYVDAGATASDLVDGTLTVTVNNPIANPAIEGVYTVTYNVSDAAGNAAVQLTRKVRVAAATSTNNGSTVQLLLTGGVGTVDIYSAGEVLFNASSAIISGTPPVSVNFPFGVIDYYTSVATLGAKKVVRLTFSTALPANLVVYKVDAGGSYTALANTLWTQVNANAIDVTLTDGDVLTDLDGISNGVIHDPLAVGGATTPVVGAAFAGGGGCVIQSDAEFDPLFPAILILLAGVSFIRRQQE